MISTVVFDLGNVILPFDVVRLADRLAAFSPYSADKIINTLWNEDIATSFETGEMSESEYFDRMTKALEFANLPIEKFLPIYNDIFTVNTAVVEIIKSLKSRYTVALISNINPIHGDHVRNTYSFLSHFDKVWYSCDVKIRKPNPKIYSIMQDHYDIPADKIVFIDDMIENIEGAESLGINGIHYKNVHQLRKELADLGVLTHQEVQ